MEKRSMWRGRHGVLRLAGTVTLAAGLAAALTAAVFAVTALWLALSGLDDGRGPLVYTLAAATTGFVASFAPWLLGLVIVGLPLAGLLQALGKTGTAVAAVAGALAPATLMLGVQVSILTGRARALDLPSPWSQPGAEAALASALWIAPIGAAAAVFLRRRRFGAHA
ncbi:MAG: hypothetical protein AAF899_05845 [Pseudomonadota bacterium]